MPGRIQVSDAFRALTAGHFVFEERGMIELEGIGAMCTLFLMGPRQKD